MSEPIKTTEFELFPWQREAVCSWLQGDGGIPYRGTLEIFTGGGKTLIALECLAKTSEQVPGLKCAIIVPTEALVEQWTANIARFTDIRRDEVGVLGAGSSDDFNSNRILVCVVNTASKRLPKLAGEADSLMLIVDECHRAGAPTFSRVLKTPARFRLGLSATPEREELDENGEPLEYDAQVLGKELGGVVFRFSLREARRQNWLPRYEIHHHGILLTETERRKYEEASRRIDDLADRLTQFGISPEEARRASSREGPAGRLAQAYVAATSKRKDLLYRASDRTRVAARLVREALARKESARILLFHERVDEAAALYERLRESAADVPVRLEHSRLPDSERRRALRDFKDGIAAVLVSVKSLIEGIDVPDADVGVSVASSSSVRQRVQSLGRVLRRTFDETQPRKEAEMHILYVTDTVDEAIYGKEDWSDLLDTWKRTPETVQMPEGETIQDVWARSVKSWQEITSALKPDETALVVAHDAVNKTILCNLLGLTPADIWAVKQGNGGVTVVDIASDPSQPAVVTCLNLTSHFGSVIDQTAAGAL